MAEYEWTDVPNESIIVMLSCTEISLVTSFFDFEKFGAKHGFLFFFRNRYSDQNHTYVNLRISIVSYILQRGHYASPPDAWRVFHLCHIGSSTQPDKPRTNSYVCPKANRKQLLGINFEADNMHKTQRIGIQQWTFEQMEQIWRIHSKDMTVRRLRTLNDSNYRGDLERGSIWLVWFYWLIYNLIR